MFTEDRNLGNKNILNSRKNWLEKFFDTQFRWQNFANIIEKIICTYNVN